MNVRGQPSPKSCDMASYGPRKELELIPDVGSNPTLHDQNWRRDSMRMKELIDQALQLGWKIIIDQPEDEIMRSIRPYRVALIDKDGVVLGFVSRESAFLALEQVMSELT